MALDDLFFRVGLDTSDYEAGLRRLSTQTDQAVRATAQQWQQALGAQAGLMSQLFAAGASNFDRMGKSLEGMIPGANALNSALGRVGLSLESISKLAPAALAFGGMVTGIKNAAEFEKQMASLRAEISDVDDSFGSADQQFQDLSQSMLDVSLSTGIATHEIEKIAAQALHLGLTAPHEIQKFTESIARLGRGLNTSGAELASGFGELSLQMDESLENVEKFGASLTWLSDRSRATAPQILGMANSIASAGKFIGLTTPEVLGLGAALASFGAAPQAVNILLTKMADAARDNTVELDVMADAAGKSKEAFRALIQGGQGAEAVAAFFEGLKRKGADATIILDNLGLSGQRVQQSFIKAAGAAGTFDKSISLIRERMQDSTHAWDDQKAAIDQFNTVLNNTIDSLHTLWNTINIALIVAFQDALSPIKAVIDALNDFVTILVREHPDILRFAGTVTMLAAGFVGVGLALRGLMAILSSAYTGLATVFGIIEQIIGTRFGLVIAGWVKAFADAGGLIAVFKNLGAAISLAAEAIMGGEGLAAAFTAISMAFTPTGWLVVGIAAVVAGLTLLEVKTGLVSSALVAAWEKTKDFARGLKEFAVGLVAIGSDVLAWFGALPEKIGNALGIEDFSAKFKKAWSTFWDWVYAFTKVALVPIKLFLSDLVTIVSAILGPIVKVIDFVQRYGKAAAEASTAVTNQAIEEQRRLERESEKVAFRVADIVGAAAESGTEQSKFWGKQRIEDTKIANAEAVASYKDAQAIINATVEAAVQTNKMGEREQTEFAISQLAARKRQVELTYAREMDLATHSVQNQKENIAKIVQDRKDGLAQIEADAIKLNGKLDALDIKRAEFDRANNQRTVDEATAAANKIAEIRLGIAEKTEEIGRREFDSFMRQEKQKAAQAAADIAKAYATARGFKPEDDPMGFGPVLDQNALKAVEEQWELYRKIIQEKIAGATKLADEQLQGLTATLGLNRVEANKITQAYEMFGKAYEKLTPEQRKWVDQSAQELEALRLTREEIERVTLARQLELAAMDLGIKGMTASAAARLATEVKSIEKQQANMETLIKAYETVNNARQQQDQQSARLYQAQAQYEGNYYRFSIGALKRYAAEQDTIWQGIDRLITNTMGNVQRSLSDTFFKYFTGETVKLKDVFKDLMHSILRELANFLASATVKTFLNFMLNVLNGQGAGDAASNAIGSLLGQRQGGSSSTASTLGGAAVSGASGLGGLVGTLYDKLFGGPKTEPGGTLNLPVGATLPAPGTGNSAVTGQNGGFFPGGITLTPTSYQMPVSTLSTDTYDYGNFLPPAVPDYSSYTSDYTVPAYAAGGRVPGAGSGDTVHAMLTPGEFVIRKDVAQKLGPVLDALNGGGGPEQHGNYLAFATGGSVPAPGSISTDALLQAILNAVNRQTTVTQQVAQNTGQTSTTVDAIARDGGVNNIPRWISGSSTTPNPSGDQDLLAMLNLGSSGIKGVSGIASGAGFKGTANALQAVAGLISLYSGLKSGNAFQAASGGLQSASSIALLLSNPAVAQALGLSPGFATGSGIVGQGLGAAQGVLGVVQGIQQGNAIGAAAGGTQTLGSIANILSQPAVAQALGYSASTANVLSGVGGGLGVVTGGLNIYQGIENGSGSQVASGALSTALGAYQLGTATGLIGSEAAAAAGTGATAGSAAISATTFTVGYIGAIAAVAIAMWQHEEQLDAMRKKQGILEGITIRNEYNDAVPKVIDAMNVLGELPGLTGLPPAQQLTKLQQIEGVLQQGWEGLKAVSHFISTKGVGTRQAIPAIGRADTSKAEELASMATPLIVAGLAKVADAEALLTGGQATPPVDFGTLFTTANNLSGGDTTGRQGDFYAGRYARQLSTTMPGNYTSTLTSLLSANNPQFSTSQFGQALNALPTFTGTPEQQMAAAQTGMFNNQQAMLSRMMTIGRGSGGTEVWGGGSGLSNADIIAMSPYFSGGWKALFGPSYIPLDTIPDAGLFGDLNYTLDYLRRQNDAAGYSTYTGSNAYGIGTGDTGGSPGDSGAAGSGVSAGDSGGFHFGGLVKGMATGGMVADDWLEALYRQRHPELPSGIWGPGNVINEDFGVYYGNLLGPSPEQNVLINQRRAAYNEWRQTGRLPGLHPEDTVPAMLTPGEFVVPKRAVTGTNLPRLRTLASTGQWVNSGGMPFRSSMPITITINILGDASDPRAIAERITPALRDELRRVDSRYSRAGNKSQG
jgi:TP901 family phage tail tape measure protein